MFNALQRLTGTWVFNKAASSMGQLTPMAWRHSIAIDEDWIEVEEEVTRANGSKFKTAVGAFIDGGLYAVVGSPVADEIAYHAEGDCLLGVARKSGAESFRERLSVQDDAHLEATLTFLSDGREVAVATAVFDRA